MSGSFPDPGLLDFVEHAVLVAVGGRMLRVAPNPAACRLFGIAHAPNIRLPLSRLVGRTAAAELAAFAERLPMNGAGARTAISCKTPRGALLLAADVARAPGRTDAFVLSLREETADATAVEALSQARTVLQSLPVGIELYDRRFNALFYNRKSDELFDYSERAVINHADWWELAFPDSEKREAARAEWDAVIAAAEADPTQAHMAEWEVMCRDGVTRDIQFYYRRAGEGFSLVLWDVSDRRRLETELRELALTDSLTGLPNRRCFFETAQSLLEDGPMNRALTVLMLDVDHFKAVNDRFGHRVGDEVLKAVAARGKAALRKEDLIARVGGEEFAALLPGTDGEPAACIARRLRQAIIAAPVTVGAVAIPVTVSIGVAGRRKGEVAAEGIVERADRALYAAKSAGRDRVVTAGEDGAAA
ncbi:sensor domain-containing diguanylate cyclase [Hansschlegelia sp.]|uniref:sensor domain-containing diguanylate cyclase n=1 Tax=Hansschlegelia sp. TaxID=2041892 RepID=UPI002CF8F1F3|nr:sensor domain-containing diguanylate cyclase [Hansschlegelia sp.]HVI30065.1 sensor domain-containing diguanylate cyclase [Hansschlegelia sp.]